MARPTLALLLLPWLGVLGSTSGCMGPARTYSGPARPRGEVAVVRIWGQDDAIGIGGYAGDVKYDVHIVSLDGRCWGSLRKILEVTPGPHTFTLRWARLEIPQWTAWRSDGEPTGLWRPTHSGRETIELVAEAGRTYELEWTDPAKQNPPFSFREVPPER